jgi:putative addiction module CopG family antidote
MDLELELTLDQPTAEFVAAKVASGEFASPGYVVRAALKMLQEHDAWLEEEDRQIDEAEASPLLTEERYQASMCAYFAERAAREATPGLEFPR